MKKLFVIIVCSWCTSVAAESADSAQTYRMNDVIITGFRFYNNINRLPSSVVLLTPVALQTSTGSSVADAIAGIPGVFVRRYGGNGSLQTISMRGMGPEYSTVLVDGEQFTSAQNSLTDLGIFLTDDVEQIEIAKGGYSSSVGSNAVSGVVNIITKKPTKEFHASLSSSIGSFGTQSNSIYLSGGGEHIRLKSIYSIERARNNYGFSFSDGVQDYTLQRTGADYLIRNLSLTVMSDILNSVQTTFSLRHSLAERGSPSGVTSPFQNSLSRLRDNNLFVISSTRWEYSPGTTFSTTEKFHYFQQNYQNPNMVSGIGEPNTYSTQRSEAVSCSVNHTFDEQNSITGGLEGSMEEVRGSDLFPRTRIQSAVYVSSEHHVSQLLDMTLFPSFRLDAYEKTDLLYNPKLGMSIKVMNAPDVRLRGSVGKNFRIPTFNELYWITGGNPALHPERSTSVDAGLVLDVEAFGNWSAEANYFMIDTRDRIVWTPGNGGMWVPKNVYQVVSSGAEFAVRYALPNDLLEWNASYSFMNVLRKDENGPASSLNNKQLPYTPFELASVSLRWNSDHLSVSADHSFTGYRYVNENNDPHFILPEFQVTNIVLLGKISVFNSLLILKAESKNIFNTHYQWIPSYPVPGRSYGFTCSFHM
ncbi:MAG: TonB-dependent receptor [Bacteroidota bacterium]|jgi:iron complex outermembrane receptor protein